MRRIFGDFVTGRAASGLLIFRIVTGAGLMLHGLQKIQSPGGMFGWMGPGGSVPGPLQGLAAFAEFGGGIALMLGLLTPIAAFGVLCTMIVAIVTVHLPKGDPFVGAGGKSFEPAALYLATALLLMLAGPGALSLDAILFGSKSRATDERAIRTVSTSTT